jgi:hypothetical protein
MATLSELIDEFVETKNRREVLQNRVTACTERMAVLEKDIMKTMSDAGITQAGSDKASCHMREKQQPAIEDWSQFYDYVAKTNQFELLHKRLSSTAFKERWDAGENIPGTKAISVWDLRIVRK